MGGAGRLQTERQDKEIKGWLAEWVGLCYVQVLKNCTLPYKNVQVLFFDQNFFKKE